MITVKPNQRVSQHVDEVVIYELPFDHWDVDLGPSPRYDHIEISTKGDVALEPLKATPGQKASLVKISGGTVGARCEVVRVVTTKGPNPEKDRQAFTVRITG